MKKSLIYPSLALTALLSACGGGGSETPGPNPGPTPTPDAAIKANAITGTVAGLPAGTHRAILVNDGAGLDVANEGTVTGGKLSVNLTRAPSDDLFKLTGNCPFTGQATAYPKVAVYNAVYVASKNIDGLALVQEQVTAGGTLKGTLVARMYSDSDATVKGTLNCQGSSVYLNVTLKQGWNALEWVDSGQSLTLNTLSSSATSTLQTSLFPKGVAVYPKETSLSFTTNDTVSTDARLYQEGGYTGQVTLSTDLPGLTIEPGTVNLTETTLSSASVNAQGLVRALGVGQQRLDTTLTFRYSGSDNYTGPVRILVKDTTGKIVGDGQITVNIVRPGISLSSPYSPEFTPGGTGTVSVYSSVVGNYSGSATYSLENLPDGVTATPVTRDSVSWYDQISLPVTVASSAKPGKYPVTIRAKTSAGGSTIGVDLIIKAPTITLYGYGYDSVTVYQGSAGSLQLQVGTDNTFNGSTTLTLTDLPAGVSATPKTVSVQPGATTTVNIPLTVSSDAVPGTYTVKVSSPDLSATANVQRTLLVRPARAALSTPVQMSADAEDGVWISAGSTYDSATQGSVTRVQRVSTSGSVLTDVTLNGIYDRLVTDGTDVIALSSNRNTPVRITSTGTQTTLSGLPANTVASGTAPRLDARGLLWMSSMEWGVGAAQTQVFAWDPVSGAVSFRQPEVTSSGNPTLRLSPDGRTLLIFPYNSYGTSIQKVETATGQSAALDAVTSVGSSSVAFAGDGTIWFGSYSGLSRLNADGTLTTFQNSPHVDTVYGFDRQAPSVLWASNSGAIQRIDVSTMKAQSIPVSGPQVGYLAAQGGLKLITYDYGYGSGTNQYYISLLK